MEMKRLLELAGIEQLDEAVATYKLFVIRTVDSSIAHASNYLRDHDSTTHIVTNAKLWDNKKLAENYLRKHIDKYQPKDAENYSVAPVTITVG